MYAHGTEQGVLAEKGKKLFVKEGSVSFNLICRLIMFH
jgi:hypothetical protein